MSMNVRVSEMDLSLRQRVENRGVEIVADELLLSHGAQLAVDTLRCHSCTVVTARILERPPTVLGWPKFIASAGDLGRARLIVVAAEVEGRRPDETRSFL